MNFVDVDALPLEAGSILYPWLRSDQLPISLLESWSVGVESDMLKQCSGYFSRYCS